MANERVSKSGNDSKRFDLEERTAKFAENVIAFAKTIPHSPITLPLIGQLVRSATSVGANYCEADDSQSTKDFKHKISLCRKEARETKYWLRMMAAAVESRKEAARPLWCEARELNLIFSSILRSCQKQK
jgi:four helix bundle protein